MSSTTRWSAFSSRYASATGDFCVDEAFFVAINASMLRSKTSSGATPERSTASWNLRMSKFSPISRRSLAVLFNFELADLVGERLARH